MSNALKRAFDVVASAAALLALSPLFLVIALWIRFDGSGPILFRQQRVGRGERRFSVLKFRTMIDRPSSEIDQHREAVVSTNDDARITRAGRWLRTTSLDELPQLWNILRGDMSLVGPRPVLAEQLEAIPAKYRIRFEVRPGLTGLAQIRGRRSLAWLEQLEADAEYVARGSLLLDLRILLKTVVVVCSRSAIYGDESKNWRFYRDQLRIQNGRGEKAEGQ